MHFPFAGRNVGADHIVAPIEQHDPLRRQVAAVRAGRGDQQVLVEAQADIAATPVIEAVVFLQAPDSGLHNRLERAAAGLSRPRDVLGIEDSPCRNHSGKAHPGASHAIRSAHRGP
jgi:hypothetical protein